MSVFVAIDLSEPARAEAQACIDEARAQLPAKWLPPEKLHVTVLFLGNPDAAEVQALTPHLDALAARHRPFSLRLTGAGTFVTARAPSVLWLGVAGDLPALHALHRDAAGCLGPHDARTYRPHLTLARAPQPDFFDARAAALRDFTGSPWDIAALTLYESTHHRYHVLHRAPLAAHAATG